MHVQLLQALPASLAALSVAVPMAEEEAYAPTLHPQDGLLLHLPRHCPGLCMPYMLHTTMPSNIG